jgi:hypothetical protein
MRRTHPATLQEFNIEKLQIVEAEKQKIRKEYERKEGLVDVKKKMCVQAPQPQILRARRTHAPRVPPRCSRRRRRASQLARRWNAA